MFREIQPLKVPVIIYHYLNKTDKLAGINSGSTLTISKNYMLSICHFRHPSKNHEWITNLNIIIIFLSIKYTHKIWLDWRGLYESRWSVNTQPCVMCHPSMGYNLIMWLLHTAHILIWHMSVCLSHFVRYQSFDQIPETWEESSRGRKVSC